jgi:2-keto-3-deoxy-L-rhamnonate aldolase RhmA
MSAESLESARKAAIPNKLRDKLAAGELAHSFSIKFVNNIEVVHYAAVAGYDAILIDLEHGTLGLDTTAALSISALQVGYVLVYPIVSNQPVQR